MANDDMELVRAYAADRSEQAFETLVDRYVSLVYSTALRQVRDPHLAEEITQAVFVILARKAGKLGANTILPSWLHRTAGYCAADALKIQRRRAQREQEAYMQSQLNEPENETWWQIAPLLDAAIARLSDKDRHAIVLRFFQNKSLGQVGSALGASEDAAKKRVSRALEKLQKFFFKRGITSTTATLAAAMTANSLQAAPATLAKTATAVALAKGVTASISTLTLIKGALKIMAWSKAKTAVFVSVCVLLAGTGAVTIVESQSGRGPFGSLMEKKRQNDMVRKQMDSMIPVYAAIMNFAQAHKDELPKSPADLKPYLPASLTGVDDEHWEILQSGKVTPEFVTQRNLILLQQKNVPPEKSKIIMYADGHMEYKK